MKNFYYTILFLGFSLFVTAQQSSEGTPVQDLVTPIKRIITTSETTNSTSKTNAKTNANAKTAALTTVSGPTGTSAEVGITEGQLSVSLSGAANYSIPIAVPSGINGVVPQVGLVYNSQSGNGDAGYGWNISGVSAITRIPRTKFHDGVVGGVNLDGDDRFALDGQRLILKSGTYGANNTEYETENFSNVRIKAIGVSPLGASYGPASFLVEYPDGSKAEYGFTTDSRSITTWSISYWENAQGIRISYSYLPNNNNNLNIAYIKYGSTGTNTPINQITFVYKNRLRTEQSYVGGQSILVNYILSDIEVSGNNVGFRNYALEHNNNVNAIEYQRLTKITEKNGNKTLSYNPTVFSYSTSSESISYTPAGYSTTVTINNATSQNTAVVSVNFSGNEKMGFIGYPITGPNSKNRCWVFSDVSAGNVNFGYEHVTGAFETVFPTNFLMTYNNTLKLSPVQGYTVVKKTDTNYTFTVYKVHNSNSTYIQEYEKTFDFPAQTVGVQCSGFCKRVLGSKIFPKKILSGDFNGDGLTDVIAVDMDLININCPGVPSSCSEIETVITSKKVYFVDLKKDNTNTTPVYSGDLQFSITSSSKVEVADVNGDGKSDLLIFENGKVTTYTLNSNNQLVLLWNYTDTNIAIDATKTILLGDYNGDGKTDFMIPAAYGSSDWHKYTNTGTNFVKNSLTSTGAAYIPNTTSNTYNYIASDYDKDGKSDLIITSSSSSGILGVSCYKNKNGSFSVTNSVTSFSSYDANIQLHALPIYFPTGRGISVSGKPYNPTLDIAFLNSNKIFFFKSDKDSPQDQLVRTITTGNGVRESITYQPLSPDSESTYNGDAIYTTQSPYTAESYPNVELSSAPSVQVVTQLEKESASVYKRQLFYYSGATSNLEGLGYLGFRTSMRTNWFDYNEDQIISSVSKFDPALRGANIENYTYLGLVAPAIASYATAPNTGMPNSITISDYTFNATDIRTASGSIFIKPGQNGTHIKPINNTDTFIAKVLPNYDSTGFTETNTTPAYSLISKSLSYYETNLTGSKVYKLQNVQSKNYNVLENTSSETNVIYDQYNNPLESITKLKNGGIDEQVTTSKVEYTSSSTPYIVGKPLNKTQIVIGSGDSTTSKEVYEYFTNTQSNLLKKIEKYGNNTSAVYEENEYDSFGNVTKKTITAGSISRVNSFVYNPASPYNGRFLTESTDAAGFKTAFEYYPNGTLQFENSQTELNNWNISTTQKTSYDYDSWFKKKTITNHLGKTQTYGYSCTNGEAKITLSGDAAENSYSEELYDELGRKTRTGIRDVQGNMSYQKFIYDIYDRNYKVSEPYANGTPLYNTTVYDVYGRPETVTDFTGKIISMSYDKLTTTVTDGSTSTTKTSVKNARGNIITMTEAPVGGTIKYSYFANGNLKETDYLGNKITIAQDGWGRKTSLTDPSAGTYTYEYNALGEMIKETTPNGTTTFNLDALGRPLSKTISGVNTDSNTVYTYDNTVSQLLIKSEYTDAKDGNRKNIIDYVYDTKKRLDTATETTAYGAIFTKKLEYDAWGRVDKETSTADLNNKISTTKIQNVYRNGFAYQIKDIQSSNPVTLWETTEVNARGQLTKATLGNTTILDNAYDGLGYLTSSKYTSGNSTVMELTNEFNPQRGNLNWRKNSLFGNLQEDFTYDDQDRLLTYPNTSGGTGSQTYKPDGRIDVNNAVGTYNYANTAKKYQNTSVTLNPEATGYYTNREGIFDDSFEERTGWDGTNIHPLNTLFYSYDSARFHSGNTSLKLTNTTVTEQYIYAEKWVDIDNAVDTQYTYSAWVYSENPDTQLFLAMKTAAGAVSHDNVDNTAVKNQWHLMTKNITVPANVKKLNIRLDNNGSGNVWFDDIKIIRTTSNPDQALFNLQTPDASYKDHQLKIKYNSFKSPYEIEETDKEKISFVYNDDNSRSVMFYGSLEDDKISRSNSKQYSTDGSMEIKTTPTGTEFVTYIAGDGYSAPVAYKKTFDNITGAVIQGQMLYLYRDYQGSILAIANDSGAILEKRQFDAWGAIAKVQDGGNNLLNGLTILDRGYTGHEHLQSVGLIHMNGRLYDPKLHRFLQPDNYVQDPSNTQNYNRYGYVLNNPLKYTDPSGEYGEFGGNRGGDLAGGGGGGVGFGLGGSNYTGGAIYETIQTPAVQEWLSKNLSARSFDKAGTAVGKAVRDATNWFTSGFKSFFGGGGGSSGLPANRATNVNMNAYSFTGSSFAQGAGKMALQSTLDGFDMISSPGISSLLYEAFGGKSLIDLSPTDAQKAGYYTAMAATFITPGGAESGAKNLALRGIESAPRKGFQWLNKMSRKYGPETIASVEKVGSKYYKYSAEVAGRNGRTIYTKYLNMEGKTVQWFHDSYDASNTFLHREFNAVGGRLKVWWDGTRQYIQKF